MLDFQRLAGTSNQFKFFRFQWHDRELPCNIYIVNSSPLRAMKRGLASLGILLVFVAIILFWSAFAGGSVGGYVITDGNAYANFVAMAFVVVFLPLGSGIAFYGMTTHGDLATGRGAQGGYGGGSSSAAKAAFGVAVIAILIGAAMYVSFSSTLGTQSGQISSLSSELSSLSGKPPAASVNVAPGVIAFRVDWSNLDPTTQDRFNPTVITVVQGSVVQILFEHNDTDAHTFTMYTPATPYGFQINATLVGMRNFLNSQIFGSSCVGGSYQQDTSGLSANGVSTAYCVSGSSLLSPTFLQSHAAANFRIALNPNPASPFTPTNKSGNPTTILLPVDNQVHYGSTTLGRIANASGTAEVYGIGAFQAITPGVYEFFCDYHVSNGMFGYLVVLPNAYCTTNAAACGITNSTSTST
jgi:plastocyanin